MNLANKGKMHQDLNSQDHTSITEVIYQKLSLDLPSAIHDEDSKRALTIS